jgi:hypothetical protein
MVYSDQNKPKGTLMLKRWGFILAAFCAASLLGGCNEGSKESSVENKQKKDVAANASEIEIDLTSPDHAVKTWWALIDLKENQSAKRCIESNEKDREDKITAGIKSAITGDALARLTSDPDCTAEAYSREIREVKQESDTRSIVLANVKNITMPPSKAIPDETDTKWREKGFEFKYVVEKTSEGWKIAQVYKFDEVNRLIDKDVWEKQFESDALPRYPAYVSAQ